MRTRHAPRLRASRASHASRTDRLRHPLTALLAAAALALATPAPAVAAPVAFDIPAQSLDRALALFARQAGLQLALPPALAQGRTSAAMAGTREPAEALAQLLRGSGLRGRIEGSELIVERLPLASEGSADSVLPVVRVSASREPETANGPLPGYVAHRSASATKTDTPLLETARAVSVITADQMRDRKALSVEEAVAYASGVQVGMSGNDPRFDEIKLRGFDVTTDADYRDGLRQPNTGWLSYFHTEPYALERLEVVKGPNSVLFGQISPGGLVNRVSKRLSRDAIREIEIQVGSPRLRQAQLDLGGPLGEPDGDWQYRLVALARKANTGTVGVNDDSLYIAPALTWSPSARTQVTLLAHWQDYRTSASPKPFQRPSGELTDFWAGDIDFDGLKQKQTAIGYEARHRFDDTFTVRQNLRIGRVRTDNQYLEATLDADGDTLLRDAYGLYEQMDSVAVDTALESRFATGAARHQLTLGVDHTRLSGDVHYLYGTAPSISMTSPDYHQPVERPSTVLVEQGVKGRQTGLYLNDQMALQDWRLTVGLRRDRVSQTQADLAASTTERQRDSASSGSLGLLYLATPSLAPYLSLATSFTPQFGRNLAGTPFKPTEGRQVEAGVKFQPADGRSLHTLSVFNLVQRNVKTRDPADEMNYLQTGELRSRGIELESSLNLSGGLSVAASYTYQDVVVTRSNDGNQGKQPVTTPRHMAALWAKKSFHWVDAGTMDLGLGARWVGKSFADADNASSNEGYALFDARIAFDLRSLLPGMTLGLNASNLTDKRYLLCQDGYCYRGRGRTVVAQLSYRW